ncbi:MAG: dTMP kinase [Alphaproteobacteria bacterium]|nr:MAG: dTMP kinase [Alphaproteobacteria bacterium]
MTDRTPRGCFITLEGGEGTGKTTQIKHLCNRLAERGIETIQTREPGGTPAGEAVRNLLVSGDTDRWQPMSEALLNYAARVEHVTHTIAPALERGIWVVSDRFADSTMAYQGICQGVGRDRIETLHDTALGEFAPDLTLILDLPVETALERANRRNAGAPRSEDRFERMGQSFHERLRAAFLEIARADPARCQVIDANGTPEQVAARIWASVTRTFGI